MKKLNDIKILIDSYINDFMNKLVDPIKNTEKYNITVRITEKNENNPGILNFLAKDIKNDIDHEILGEKLCDFLSTFNTGNIIVENQSSAKTSLFLNGYLLTAWNFDFYKLAKTKESKIYFSVKETDKKELESMLEKTKGVLMTRYLSLVSGNHLNPDTYENFITELFQDSNISVEVIEQKQLEKMKCQLINAVGNASEFPPRVVIIKRGEHQRAFIGKGITYDTGGLSLKPTNSMDTMYYDMSGSATLVGAAYAMLKTNHPFKFLLPLVENSLGSKSYRPGDIYENMHGKTVEIGNTDAEGRLILADAAAIAVSKYSAKEVICIGTLTGAANVALGNEYSALLCQDKSLSEEIIKACDISGEKAYQLPFDKSYEKKLSSKRADFNNISQKGEAGTITAWKFIEVLLPEGIKYAGWDIAASSGRKLLCNSSIINNAIVVRSVLNLIK